MPMKLNPHLLPILVILVGSTGGVSAQTPGSTPHTYAKCTELGLTDSACHRQIIEAGGTVQSSPTSTRTVVPQNFRGWSEQERWYRKYVEYAKRGHYRIKPIEDVIEHYPGFPISIPYYLAYP